MRALTLLFLSALKLLASQHSDAIYNQIKDIKAPSSKDYQLIQDYLDNGFILYRDRMIDWRGNPLPRDVKIYSDKKNITYKVKSVNVKKKDRDNCIVLYSTFYENYPDLVSQTYESIINSSYKGHIIYRIGGFPNEQGGDIVKAHLPRAFKVAAFKEAYDLGFKYVLWLNAGMIPMIDLAKIFKRIKTKGVFGYLLPYNIRMLCHRNEHIHALNISRHSAFKCFSIHSSILGINFEDEKGLAFFNMWYDKTTNHEQFSFLPLSNTCNLSYIANQFFQRSSFPNFFDHVNTDSEDQLEFTYLK